MTSSYSEIESLVFTKFAPKVRDHYEIAEDISGHELKSKVLSCFQGFGQVERGWDASTVRDEDIFRAATWAIASNSRTWKSVYKRRNIIEAAVAGFDLKRLDSETAKAKIPELADALRGQYAKSDARGIFCWVVHLGKYPNYALNVLAPLRGTIQSLAEDKGIYLTEPEVAILSACSLGIPTPAIQFATQVPSLKAPRMGAILASEFLRNLGWSGFKPDRHVQKLLQRWCPQDFAAGSSLCTRAAVLCRDILGSRSVDRARLIHTCLVGVKFTPPQVPVMIADQVIWLYGSLTARAKSV